MLKVSHLIEQFVPDTYTLYIDLQREERTFHGQVDIHGSSLTSSGEIRVHSKDLVIVSVLVDGKAASFAQQDNDELVISHPDIVEGPHLVTITFDGTITDGMHGLYPCYYEHDGNKKELLATQFESHHAREVFPCIDEPAAKATFALTLSTEENIVALSNMPVKKQHVQNGRLTTIFTTSPRMSTYLVAWVTGELQYKTATSKSGVEVRIWATPAQAPESLDFALSEAIAYIDFYNDYFGTPYPLPKSDHVALPDFSAGAMENWGLITYRETALLVDPKTAGITSRRYVALVIAHELSHQWFGNLVTMKWWNDLWLNESFAELMQFIAMDALHPDWNVWLEFSAIDTIKALQRDSLDGVQSVESEVNHPDEINTLFDPAIVYAKGARLLRMLQHYIGSEAFKQGLKRYFAAHAYGSTTGEDLWRLLSEESGQDITEFMKAWISQPGYPVVKVEETENNLHLTQHQFFVGAHQPSSRLWPIPLGSLSSAIPPLLNETTLTLPSPQQSSAVRLNIGNTAHFITSYDEQTMQKIRDEISQSLLSPLDRLQILHEQLLLAKGQIIPFHSIIPLLQTFRHETDESVWTIIALVLGELRILASGDTNAENGLNKLTRELARPMYEQLGWTSRASEPETHGRLRAIIVGLMLDAEIPEVVKQALTLYETHELIELDPELRPLIVGAAVRYSDSDTVLEKLFTVYKETVSATLKADLARGMSRARRGKDIDLILDSFKSDAVRPQDMIKWYVWMIQNQDSRAKTWRWTQNNWSWIEKTFGGDKNYDRFPRFAATALASRAELEEYRAFFSPMVSLSGLKRTILLGLNEIEGRVTLIERDGDTVRRTLAEL